MSELQQEIRRVAENSLRVEEVANGFVVYKVIETPDGFVNNTFVARTKKEVNKLVKKLMP